MSARPTKDDLAGLRILLGREDLSDHAAEFVDNLRNLEVENQGERVPTMTKLRLADDLQLPAEIAGQTVGLVGIRGSGKTNTAGVIAEELLDRHQPIVVLDPTDAWWGLRSGYPVFIFGGPHGDIPLAETDGKVLAEFVVTEQVPLILSLRHLRKNAQRRFVTDFCEELYHLKGRDEYRSPLTVFLDEASLFIPQRVLGEAARTVGAVEDLIARGRNSGFGVVLINQRPATINKDVLSQADTILSHRLTSPQDRKALAEWIEENATIEEYKSVLASLATLKTGQAWVWAPSVDIIRQVQIRKRRTFDSSAAPKVGHSVTPPKKLADIDLDKLKGKLAATIEKAKAEDPKQLRIQLVEAKRVLESHRRTIERLEQNPAAVETIKEVPVLRDGQLKRLEDVTGHAQRVVNQFTCLVTELREISNKLWNNIPTKRTNVPTRPDVARRVPIRIHTAPSVRINAQTSALPKVLDTDISRPQQSILDALAWLESVGVKAARRTQVAFLAGASPKSSAFVNNLGALRARTLIGYPSDGNVSLTNIGSQVAHLVDRPLTSDELHDAIYQKLPIPQCKILRAVIDVYPKALDREELASRSLASPTSSTYVNNLGALRSLGFIDYPDRGHVAAQPVLFLE